jgi:hypothetical protein
MRLISRKISTLTCLLAALCLFLTMSGNAQTLYLGVSVNSSPITLGQSVTLTANCNPQNGYPEITYFSSSSPNPNVGASYIGSGSETTWTPPAAGTYYISASFTSPNVEGSPTCESNDTIPIFTTLVVNP